MAQTAGYPTHPTHFAAYDYPRTPLRNNTYTYYSPQQFSYSAPPARGHARRATGDGATFTFIDPFNTTPRKSAYYVPPQYSSPAYYVPAQTTPQRKSDHVSNSDRKRKSTQRKYWNSKQYSSRTHVVFDEVSDHEYECLPRYEQYEARPPPYMRAQSYYESGADYHYHQIPIFTAAEPTERTRPRRASHATKPTRPSVPRRPSKPQPKATEADALRRNIPAGFSLKNWDPTEEPILLLGSVFDANSLGKWIYDWAVYFFGPAKPLSDVAGDLWLLLINVAGKMKRADECFDRIRKPASRDLVDEFLEAGDRLWDRFRKILKTCEQYMWKAAREENPRTEKITMGKNSGCEFVASMFGRDRELEKLEKLMQGMRLWAWRFDANCLEILQYPSR